MAEDIDKDSILSLFNPFQTSFEYVLSQNRICRGGSHHRDRMCVPEHLSCEKNHLSAKTASKDRRVILMLAWGNLIAKKLFICITFLFISVYAGCSQPAVS